MLRIAAMVSKATGSTPCMAPNVTLPEKLRPKISSTTG